VLQQPPGGEQKRGAACKQPSAGDAMRERQAA
jgi:hypothetical protein